jgi:Fe-S cluster assembly iron-binding protein IscA
MKVTEQALAQFKKAIQSHDKPGAGIRLTASAGCCGPLIQMSMAEHLLAGEKMLSIDGVDFFIEPQAEQMLSNIIIDFREDGFKLEGLSHPGGCCG